MTSIFREELISGQHNAKFFGIFTNQHAKSFENIY